MSAEFIARMRAARQTWVAAGGFQFLIQRPTPLEIAELRGRGNRAFLAHCVVGWRGVREEHLLPSGGADEMPFDADTCIEWLGDWNGGALMSAVAAEINRLIDDYAAKVQANEKN